MIDVSIKDIQRHLTPLCSQTQILQKDVGVVTACDSNFFNGAVVLWTALNNRVPLTIFDIGLKNHQWKFFIKNNINVITVDTSKFDKSLQGWQTVYKPFYLSRTPYVCTLWLDSDCIPIGDIHKLFCMIYTNFVVIKHCISPQFYRSNHKQCYINNEIQHDESIDIFNAGVIGYCKGRDANIIRDWCFVMRKYINEPHFRKYITWYDEGGLNYLKQWKPTLFNILSDRSYNRMIMINSDQPHFGDGEVDTIKCNLLPRLLYRAIKDARRGTSIFHECGPEKHWQSWNISLEQ